MIASAIVASINVVAEFEIHIDKMAAASMKPKTSLRPETPTSWIM